MKSDSIKTYSYRVSQASKSDLIVILYDIAMESVRRRHTGRKTMMNIMRP